MTSTSYVYLVSHQLGEHGGGTTGGGRVVRSGGLHGHRGEAYAQVIALQRRVAGGRSLPPALPRGRPDGARSCTRATRYWTSTVEHSYCTLTLPGTGECSRLKCAICGH